MRDAIREINASLSDYFDQATAVRVGKLLGARAIVYGKSEVLEKEEKLTAWIQVIETGEKLPTVYAQARRTHPAGYGGMRSALLPGWGQWACGQRGAGAFFMVAAVGLGGSIVYAGSKAGDARDQAVLAGTIAERDRFVKEERDWKNRRNWFLAGLGAVWMTNVLHAAWVSSHTPIYAEVQAGGKNGLALVVRF